MQGGKVAQPACPRGKAGQGKEDPAFEGHFRQPGQQSAQQAAQPAAEQPAADDDPLVTNRWGITLHQSEWDEIYRQSGARPDDCTGYSSGIDWTKDPSCAENSEPARDMNGNIVHGGYDASAATPPADSGAVEEPAAEGGTGEAPAQERGETQPQSEETVDG